MTKTFRSAFWAILLVPMLATAQTDATEGTWTASVRDDGRVQLSFHYPVGNQWGRPVERRDLAGLTDAQLRSAALVPVTFRIVREAGVLEMEGAFREGRGSGHFHFRPDRRFPAALRGAGVSGTESATDRELLHLALAGTTVAAVRELIGLGLQPLTMRNVFELAIHGVTPEYVRQMRALGLTGANTPRALVELKIHRITPEFVRELEGVGFRGLERRQLLEMGIHGVSAAEVRELRALGFRDLTPRQVVQMRIHRVTPAFVREMRAAGYDDVSPETLVRMRIHGIDPPRRSPRARG